MSLMQQKNSPSNTKTVDSILSEYDYIIVGAGSAGSTLASRLSEVPCVNILLLEAGKAPPLVNDVPGFFPFFPGTDLDWKYETVPQKYTGRQLKDRRLGWPSGKSLGGSSVINAMLYVRGNRHNYDDWAAQGATGWSYRDVLPYFMKLENNTNPYFVEDGFHGTSGPVTVQNDNYHPELRKAAFEAALQKGYSIVDPNGPTQTGFYDPQGTARNHQRCSTAKAYLVPAENRTNLDILPEAFVRKVIIEDKRAVGVLFEVNGVMHQVRARREVIMSAGTVKTPQLLMLSGIGPKEELQKHKIPVIMNLPVGNNLQDHCTAPLGFLMDSNFPTLTEKILSKTELDEYIQHRKGALTSYGYISAIAFLNTNSQPAVDFPRFQLYIGDSSSKLFLGLGITKQAYIQTYKPYEHMPMYWCGSQILQPRSRGTIRLKSADPHDPPLNDPNYLSDPRDVDDVVAGLRTCHEIGTSEAMRQIGSKPFNTTLPGCEKDSSKYGRYSDQYFRCVARSVVLSQMHVVGTSKMGDPDDPTTVVDPKLRVKGIAGLRVVDASVMPTITSGNTNIPTIMVAEKAADIIKETIQKC